MLVIFIRIFERFDKIKDLKEQLADVKSKNAELNDKVESLNIDLQAAQKKTARNNVRNKLASLLSSSKSDNAEGEISAQQYVDLKSKFEEQKVQLNQERAKSAQLQRQVNILNNNIQKLKKEHDEDD